MRHQTPAATVGVVGGGQLGRMMGEAAGPLGVELVVSDPTPDCPAAPVVRDQIVADFDDYDAIHELAERADVLTFEIELADPDEMAAVSEATDTPVHPTPETLRTIQDKLVQNRALDDAGIPIPAYRQVDSVADLRAAGEALGWPLMLKAREGGYDGRGNRPVEGPEEAPQAFEAVGGAALAEELIDFERELAVMGVRGADETCAYPVTETVHEAEILRELVAPARVDDAVRERAREVAFDVLEMLDGRGVFGIELFETADGGILVNEIAPRPHNSGHWTIEGAGCSQFEQHVRAVLGWPLGSAEARSPAVTRNILGDVDQPEAASLAGTGEVLSTPSASLHWYGKREVRPLRKMGHVTATDADANRGDLLQTARELDDALTFET
ncbi:5-(carboxyamino)imidazole ribonucleotide synthase [Natronomonas pharaonis DSM 2160]|uniref:N5-carboxyaminoimidazole ribonucleotide synthase n=1 Tax=Natronomonas pharaonis (strain ATCC 35678 / DSM 2160 / CIP 103997 / JCM 8858 / NBRC 14720 / NCIMB 2260 / Gabara) TaxID=348780 RepID=A0A1U7EVZ3_NATPD|nr:5-(carboxyamino)imidazole ribonucleotide synthase [Natronomonas pharaonis]CAI49234.1 5-(carboxyamino)imidazole ribonucleotide synthase [Natronomonas pharaonis DSM 2160]